MAQSHIGRQLLQVLASRRCTRAFLPTPPPLSLLNDCVRVACAAPSSSNNQPWGVMVLGGAECQKLSAVLLKALETGQPAAEAAYQNRPAQPHAREQVGITVFGKSYYEALGLAQRGAAGRLANDRRNLQFFGAPVQMIVHAPSNAVAGTFLDVGFFVSALMTALNGVGLGCCPQFSVAKHARLLREHLNLGSDRLVVCGMAVGYPDPSQPINTFKPARLPLTEVVRVRGFADKETASVLASKL